MSDEIRFRDFCAEQKTGECWISPLLSSQLVRVGFHRVISPFSAKIGRVCEGCLPASLGAKG
jgi:hypothetical protein